MLKSFYFSVADSKYLSLVWFCNWLLSGQSSPLFAHGIIARLLSFRRVWMVMTPTSPWMKRSLPLPSQTSHQRSMATRLENIMCNFCFLIFYLKGQGTLEGGIAFKVFNSIGVHLNPSQSISPFQLSFWQYTTFFIHFYILDNINKRQNYSRCVWQVQYHSQILFQGVQRIKCFHCLVWSTVLCFKVWTNIFNTVNSHFNNPWYNRFQI